MAIGNIMRFNPHKTIAVLYNVVYLRPEQKAFWSAVWLIAWSFRRFGAFLSLQQVERWIEGLWERALLDWIWCRQWKDSGLWDQKHFRELSAIAWMSGYY